MVNDSVKTIVVIIVVAIALAAATPLFVGTTQSSANVVLTLRNSNDYISIHYRISVNSEQKLEGDIAVHGTVIRTITILFPIGIRSNFHANIVATVDSSDLISGYSVTLTNGQNLPITFDLH